MDPQAKIPLQDMDQIQMLNLVDQIAEEYRDVLKIRLKNKGLAGVVEEIGVRQRSSAGFFDVDTGAIAVVEHRTGGKPTRQVIELNNGFRSEKSAPIARDFGEPHRLVQQGPFRGSINGEKVTYIKHGDVRIEYKGQQVTRIVGPDEVEIPRAKFGDVKIFPNEHHAEMRILQWAERNNYRIVALAPTRGCCPHCALAMQQYFAKQNVNIDDAIPKGRQNRSLWRAFLKEMRTPKPAPVEYKVKGGRLDVAALRAKFKTQATVFKTPDPRLVRIAKVLKVAGPAMLAFDAATSYAKAADQWDKGERDAAAETLAEFGGRAAGAFVGAEACGLAFAGCGSVIPGLGTTVGGLAGIVIGGAVGAYLGEQGARQLCDQIIAWSKGEQPSGPPPRPPVASTPQSTNPEVAKLQSEMQAAGYSAPEISGIGRLFESPALQGKSPTAAFQQIAGELVPPGATNEGDTWLAQYPEPGEPEQKVAPVQSLQQQTTMPPSPAPVVVALPPVQPPPQITPASRHDQNQQPQIVESVHAEIIKPQNSTQTPVASTTEPLSSGTHDVEVVSTSELSERVDQLRSRLQDYDSLAAGQAASVSREQFEADSNELRNIQDQLTLSGASPLELHALQVKLNEVRNRYEQVESDTNWAEDRKAAILQKQQDEERWRADQAARDGRRADEAADAANVQQQKDRHLRDIEEDDRKKRERDRLEDERRAGERQQQEQDEDARRRKAAEDREASWKAEDARQRESDLQRDDEYRKTQEIRNQQDAEARDRAAKLAEEQRTRDADRHQQDAATAQQLAEDNRNREAEFRRDADARKADQIRSQQDADARAQSAKLADEQRARDAERHQQEIDRTEQLAGDDRRRADEAAQREDQRLRDDREAQRRIDAAYEQALADEQRRVDEQRRQDAIQAQKETDAKLLAAKEDEYRADALRQQELNQQIADQARRDRLNSPPAESTARTDTDDRQAGDNRRISDEQRSHNDRRDAEDAQCRAEKERQSAEQRLADQAALADRERQLDQQARQARQTPENTAQSREPASPRDEDTQPVGTRDTPDRQGEVDLQVEARLVTDALRKQELEQQQRQEQATRREEQQRRDDERRAQLEQQRRLEEVQYQQQLEEQRRAEEQLRRQQELEQQHRLQEAWRQQQEEQQRLADEQWRRQQEEEQQRQLEAAWRQQQEEQQRQAEEDEWRRRQQQEEEQRQMQEIWRQQQEEQERRAEEENRRQQEEEQRRREDEWRQQQEEQQRRQQEDDWRRQQQEEADRRQRQEEEDRKNVSGKILWPGQDPYP